MAASLALMTSPQAMGGAGGGGGGAFSPLTLFECTITNATMLIDSMAARDLMVAFKIVTQLNSHLVEAMEPQFVRIADTADAHAHCPPPPAPPQSTLSAAAAAGGPMSSSQSSSSVKRSMMQQSDSGEHLSSMKREYNSDDDCQILDDDASGSMFGSFDIVSNVPGGGGSGASGYGASPAKISRTGGATGGADLSDTGELSAEWKGILRKAYRQLKEETGSNVFDFALPYSAGVNMEAAKLVIDKALQITRFKPTNIAAWTSMGTKYLNTWFYGFLKADYNRSLAKNRFHLVFKLNRRQKAYESLKPTLEVAARERYESVLNRDYTSSDEECGADLDSEMRVKQLPWESEELRSIKHQLDRMFHDSLADEKQRGEMTRLRRDPACRSSRPPPADCPAWAKKD